jgi:quercetin dioxygenase-like cupin family protein
MIEHNYAPLAETLDWVNQIITSRDPDLVINDGEATPYLLRWHLLPKLQAGGVMVHRILRSDKDVPHDHPWDNTTLVLDGEMIDEALDGTRRLLRPGDILHRKAEDAHRLILAPDQVVTTLFFVQERRREWGFHCPKGWVYWRDFVDPEDEGRVGRGCGEMA